MKCGWADPEFVIHLLCILLCTHYLMADFCPFYLLFSFQVPELPQLFYETYLTFYQFWKREWTISYTLMCLWRTNTSKKLNSQHFSRPGYHLLCEGLHWGTDLTTSSLVPTVSCILLLLHLPPQWGQGIMHAALPNQDASLPREGALILAQTTLNISWMKWNERTKLYKRR